MRSFLRIGLLAGLPCLVAACGASGGGASGEAVPGVPAGSTLSAVRGETGGLAPLRPEPGNIWADGLQAETPPRAP
ncbi:hypothetical protein CR162_06860 [Pseudoroseomonas rhizosphaerae]|uniref:Uncharacterized protein n=1 Tax=Teichococcus rhizosphaerae TaxID=1335062 RepID=A0A2C6ZAP1_9PROT|nr:hypothetical protein CR162_06860 [Pseudoroseomonas rhizosphaerae]